MSVINDNVLMRFAVLFPFRTTTKRYKICFTLFFFAVFFIALVPDVKASRLDFFFFFLLSRTVARTHFSFDRILEAFFSRSFFVGRSMLIRQKERKKLNSCERDRSRQGKTEKKKAIEQTPAHRVRKRERISRDKNKTKKG